VFEDIIEPKGIKLEYSFNDLEMYLLKVIKGYFGVNKKYVNALRKEHSELYSELYELRYESILIKDTVFDNNFPKKERNLEKKAKRAVEKMGGIKVQNIEKEFIEMVDRVLEGENVRPSKIAKLISLIDDFSFIDELKLKQFMDKEIVQLIYVRILRERENGN